MTTPEVQRGQAMMPKRATMMAAKSFEKFEGPRPSQNRRQVRHSHVGAGDTGEATLRMPPEPWMLPNSSLATQPWQPAPGNWDAQKRWTSWAAPQWGELNGPTDPWGSSATTAPPPRPHSQAFGPSLFAGGLSFEL
eukprot:gnl/TRDRNA2_/TRDRNA2_122504_c1_seq1.p1 gnl/TRDRNA2_/TRDRNA2_122504_c1~~gnl/TRDRNA2_/TRDRNA2_122504_c1_seq1.p1  ORF type:complete len:153 (-),score=24.49 gnl/TRDRNA2_/TRDRNA2_122504_c1_seq1:51-458(-)